MNMTIQEAMNLTEKLMKEKFLEEHRQFHITVDLVLFNYNFK